jgi:hypothetical protein
MTRVAIGFELASAVAIGVAMAAAAYGPIHLRVIAATVSVRALWRPLVLAIVLLAIRLWRTERTLTAMATVASRATLGGVIVAGVTGWVMFLSATIGGADSYGYVSAADRLLGGRLIAAEPLAALLPFADAITAATPLGYVPAGRVANASVPAYPLGLPLVMAAAHVIGGSQAPFWVAPIAAVLLLTTAAIAVRVWYGDPFVALLAAALVAINPLVFTYAIQPMSDVPAAAAFMIAVAGLSMRAPWPVTAGLAGALALAIRPALAPAIGLLAVIPLLDRTRRSWRAAATYAALVIAAAAAQGWSQWYLYGTAAGSGYGSISGLFSWSVAATNAWIYSHWTSVALGPVWAALVILGLVAVPSQAARWAFALATAGIVSPYLFYRPYDHWETLRFLLPCVVIATIVAAAGLAFIARRALGPAVAAPASAAVVIALASSWLSWVSVNQVLTMPAQEARHRIAGDMVLQTTGPDAVVLALQHSGSLRYYAGRQTLNWDRIPPGALDPTVRALQAAGRRVFVMIDSAEERSMFDARHGPVLKGSGWLPGGQRRNIQLFEATPR